MARQRDSLSHAPAEYWLPLRRAYQRMHFGEQSHAGLGIRRIVRNAAKFKYGAHRILGRGQQFQRSDAARSAEHDGQGATAFVFIWINNQRHPTRLESHLHFSWSKSAG